MAKQYDVKKKDLMHRLNRIEGQVRGISRMIDDDKYCIDIMTQISAVRSALSKVGQILLDSHMRSCVSNAIKEEHGDESIDELMQVIRKFM